MKAYIVRAIVSTRVIVPDGYDEDQITTLAIPNIIRNAETDLCSDMECEEDFDCPYDEEDDIIDLEKY